MFSYDDLIRESLIDADAVWRYLDSFWRERTTTSTRDLVHTLTWATLINELAVHSRSQHFIAAQTVPDQQAWYRQPWYPLVIFEDRLSDLSFVVYGSGAEYSIAPEIYYGESGDPLYIYPAPRKIHSIPMFVDSVTDASVVIDGSQFRFDEDRQRIEFEVDPFSVLEAKVDEGSGRSYVVLWMRNTEFDLDTPFDWTGWVAKFDRQGDNYAEAVKHLWELILLGPSIERYAQGLMASLGFPFALADETVRRVTSDGWQHIIATDSRIYRAPLDVAPIVSQGDEITEGDPLTDGITFWEYDNILSATTEQFPGLALTVTLSTGDTATLTFMNVDTEWSYDAGRPSPWRFPVGGAESDVERWWIDVDTRLTDAGLDFATLYGLSAPGPNAVNPAERIITDLIQNSLFVASIDLRTLHATPSGYSDRARRLLPKDMMLVLQQFVSSIADAYALGSSTSESVDYGYNEPASDEVISVAGSGTDLQYTDLTPIVTIS